MQVSVRTLGLPFAATLAFLILATAVWAPAASADSSVVITLASDVQSVQADGHSQANISVQAWVDQSLYTGSVQVTLRTSLGTLDPSNLTLNNGTGWTHLRAGAGVGVASVTVQVTAGPRLVVLPMALQIEFVAAGTAAQPVINRRFMTLRADDLEYSMLDNRITALQHASAVYHNIDVKADSISVDLATMELRAESLSNTPIVATCRNQSLKARRFYVNFTYNMGAALVIGADGKVSLGGFSGDNLISHQIPMLQPPDALVMPEAADASVVIRARKMDVYPGNEIHCTGASFYVSGKCVLALPYYRLALSATSPTQDQYVTYDTYTGLGINIPFYYMLNDGGMGSIRIKRQEQTGFLGSDTQGGWSLGIQQNYGQTVAGPGSPPGSGGVVTLDRITTKGWGYSWQNDEHFGRSGLFNTYLYSPDHQSVTGNVSVYSPFHGLGLSLTSFENYQPGLDSGNTQFAVDLPQKTLWKRRIMFNISSSMAMQFTTSTVGGAETSTMQWTPGTGVNISLAPWVLDRSTSVAPAISSRYFLPATGGYQSTNAGISLNHLFGRTGSLGVTYNWSSSGGTGSVQGFSSQVLSANLYKAYGTRTRLTASPSYEITQKSLYSTSSVSYLLSRDWTIDMAAQLATVYSASLNDWQLGLARSLFGRSVRVYYEGLTHKVRFEVTGGQFSF